MHPYYIYSSTTTKCRTLSIIPRVAGVSARSTTWFILRNPKPRIVCRMPFGQAMKLRTHLILSIPDVFLAIARDRPGALSA